MTHLTDRATDRDGERARRIDPNSKQEIVRRLPAGVKQWLRRVDVGDDLEVMPASVLAWLQERDVIQESKKRGSGGRLVFTNPKGISVLNSVKNQLRG